jgi:hypothetical protein
MGAASARAIHDHVQPAVELLSDRKTGSESRLSEKL